MANATDNSCRMPRLNWRLLPRLKESGQVSGDAQAVNTPPGIPVKGSEEPPTSSPAECRDDLPPLKVVIVGDTAQIDRSPLEKDEWTAEDFASLFVLWLTHTYPNTRGKWVSAEDIECEYFERFQVASECFYLERGTLLRGLSKLLGKAGKRERAYTDATGKRREKAEYKIAKVASNVIDLAAGGRDRFLTAP